MICDIHLKMEDFKDEALAVAIKRNFEEVGV